MIGATFVEVKKWRCLNNVFLMTLGSKMVNFRSLSLRKSQDFQIPLLRGLKQSISSKLLGKYFTSNYYYYYK